MTQGEELRRLLRYLAPHTPALAAGVLLMAGMGVAEGLVAFAIKPAIDVVLNPQSSLQKLVLFQVPGTDRIVYMNDFVPSRVHHVWSVFALALLFIFLFQAVAEYFGATLIQYVGLAGITDLRNRVYAKVVQQPVGFFHDNPVGRVMSAVISDIEQVRSAFSDYLADFFRQIFSLVIFVVVLLVVDWRMAVGAAVFVPLVVWPVGKLTRRIRRSTEKSRSRLADLSQILQETISGNRVVKAFGMEDFEIRKFGEAARNLLRENMRWIRAMAATGPMMDVLGAVVVSMILFFARGEIKADRMTIGSFGAFTFALFKAYEPIKRLGGIYQLFVQALGTSAQVFRFLDLPEEKLDPPGARALPRFSTGVEFDDATFMYEDGESATLKNISLKVPAGAVVAIVGSSGAGKTTLVNLLPRFYAATSGVVRIDGHDVREVTLRSLREPDGDRHAGNNPVQRHHLEQPLLRPAQHAERKSGGRGEGGDGARFHHATAEGLPNADRRPRPAAFRRAAPAPGNCARFVERCANFDSRRSDIRARLRIRNAGAKRVEQSDDRPHGFCDCAPALNNSPRRLDCRAGSRHNSRARYS